MKKKVKKQTKIDENRKGKITRRGPTVHNGKAQVKMTKIKKQKEEKSERKGAME